MHQSRKVRRSAKWIGNSWKFTKQMWVPTWLPIWLHIIYIMLYPWKFHGIPWCTKLPKKEESVIFCMHPLRPTGQRTLGAPGGGDVGGLAAPWHDGEIEGLVSVQWGSSHFLMGIQWLQIDKPCIALHSLAELAEFERWKYAETHRHRHVHSPRLHISHWKRIQSLEDSKMDPFKLSEMAQSGANNINWY